MTVLKSATYRFVVLFQLMNDYTVRVLFRAGHTVSSELQKYQCHIKSLIILI